MSSHWPTADQQPGATPAQIEFARRWRDMPKVVFSSTTSAVDWNARLVTGDAVTEITRLKTEDGGPMDVAGATLAAAAMRAGLIDEYAIVTHPVLVGGGTPFFTALDNWVNLNLVETRTFPDGVLLTRYETRPEYPTSDRRGLTSDACAEAHALASCRCAASAHAAERGSADDPVASVQEPCMCERSDRRLRPPTTRTAGCGPWTHSTRLSSVSGRPCRLAGLPWGRRQGRPGRFWTLVRIPARRAEVPPRHLAVTAPQRAPDRNAVRIRRAPSPSRPRTRPA